MSHSHVVPEGGFLKLLNVVFAYFFAVSAFALTIFLQVRKFTFNSHPILFLTIYIAGTMGVLIFARKGLPNLELGEIQVWGVSCFVLCVSAALCVWYFGSHPISEAVLERHPNSFFMRFDLGFVISKFGDVVFQQAIIITTYFLIAEHFENLLVQVLIFTALFFVSHLFLIYFQGQVSQLHLVGSLIAGALFPIILHSNPGALPVLILVHWSFYPFARYIVAQAVY